MRPSHPNNKKRWTPTEAGAHPLADAFDQLDFEYVTGVAEKAMRAVTEQRVPPTPQNFHVWFKYALGTPVELKRTIDILVANKRKFDAATNRDLYTTYVGSKGTDEAAAYQVSQQLHAVLASAQQFLNTAIADNRTQIEAISEVADRSEAGVDPRLLVETLMNELGKAATRATKLETQFTEKSRELDVIRESLSQSEERARTDTLTGLPNRRALEEFFRTAQTEAMEQGRPLSALLIDIDHFKRFNDNFGHGVGDQVLRLVAKAVRERVREQRSRGPLWRRGADRGSSRRGSRRLHGDGRTHPPRDRRGQDHPPFLRRGAARHHRVDRRRPVPARRIHGGHDRPLRPRALSGQEARPQPCRDGERDRAGAGDGVEHDPEKACPALDAGCVAVFRNDHAQSGISPR